MAVASVALAATMATAGSAWAAAPELGRCVKQSGGKYKSAQCITLATGTGTYEWEPGPGAKPRFSETATGTPAFTWILSDLEESNCTGESATGEFTGPNTVGNVVIVLTGCKVQTRAPTESPITLAALKGEIGVYKLGATQAGNKLALELGPEPGTVFASFNCGENPILNPYEWRGGRILVPLTSNHMLTTQTLLYKGREFPRGGVEQVPAHFVGQAADEPEGSGSSSNAKNEKVFEPGMLWRMTTTLVSEEPIEINAVA